MKLVLVIHEIDKEDDKRIVVGVADSAMKAKDMILKYYGEFKELKFDDIRESNLEFAYTLEVLDHTKKPYIVYVWTEWFSINDI
jgi:hypothetical protein